MTAAQLNVLFTSQGADRVQGDLKSIDDSLSKIGTAYAAAGAAGVAGLGLMANASMQLETAMANVQSISGATEAQLAGLTDQVMALSAEMGKAPTELADALYEINSSGFSAGDALEILEKSAIAAGAGLTTVDTAATATTAVLNAYGQGAEEAGNVTDVLFKTVESGVLTFEELANNMGTVLPIASSLGIAIDELGAAYATMTLQGINASAAETNIAAIMRAALNATDELTEAVQEYGYANAEALIQAEGLVGFLAMLEGAAGGSQTAMMDLLGTQEAMTGAMALLATGVEGFNAMLLDMESAASDGQYALSVFETQTDTTAFAIDRMLASLQNAFINMGDALTPAIRSAAEGVTSLTEQFNNLSAPAQSAVATFAAVASGAALFGGSLLVVIPKIVEFRNAMAALRASGSALAVLTGAMGPLALGIAAVAAGAVYLHGKMGETRDTVEDLNTSFESLNNTVQQLQLGNFGERAEGLLRFSREVEGALISADAYVESEQKMINARRISAETGQDLYEVVNDLNEAYTLNADGQERLATAMGIIDAAFLDQSVDAEKLSATLTALREEYRAGNLTLDEYVEGIITVAATIGEYGVAADGTVKTNKQLATSFTDAAAGAGELTDKALGSVDAIERLAEAEREWIAYNEYVTSSILELTNRADYLSQVNLAGFGTGATEAAESFTNAAAALDSVLAIFGQIDAMESRMGKAGAIADYLFGPDGNPWDSIGPMRDVFDAGLISWEQFTQAIEDGIAVQEAAAASQVYLDKMRVDQLPILRETTEAYLEQIQAISELDAAEQMVALGWMDTGMQGRVQQFAELANQLRAIGPAGEVAMQQVVDGIVATDPVMTQMLLNLGLIEQQANGDYTINMDTASAMDSIGQLTEAIVALIDFMDDGALNQSFTLEAKVETPEPPEQPDWAQDGYLGGWWGAGLDVPTELQEPAQPNWAQDGYLGAWWGGGISVPTEYEPPVWPDFDIPQPEPVVIPAEVDTGAAAASLSAFQPDPISVDVIVNVASSWGGAVGGAAGEVAGALGGGNRFGIPETIDVAINGDASDLFAATEGARSAIETMPKEATVYIYGDESGAMTAIGNAGHNLAVLDGSEAMLYVLGDNSDAMAAIGEAQAYDGSILATAYVDIVARQIGSGAAIGSNIVAGARSALGIRSPSREFEEIGKYTAMGFNQGFEREFSEMNFGYSASAVASPMYAGYGAGVAPMGGGTFAPEINITVNPAPGMDEDALAESVMRRMAPALENARRQQARSMGGTR